MRGVRRLLLGGLSAVLMGSLIGGATFALFSAESRSAASDFQSGTLDISNADKTLWDTEVANMAPGDSFEKTITVTNTGSLELEFAGTSSRTGALFQGATPATVELVDAYGTLAPAESKDVTVRVSLPRGASNDYQTATGNVTVTFHAFQTKNLTAGVATAVQTNDNVLNSSHNLHYDGYTFNDAAGNLIPLTDTNLLAIYEIRPNATANYLAADGSADPKLWLNNAKPDGTYDYVIVTLSGTRYTSSITHTSN